MRSLLLPMTLLAAAVPAAPAAAAEIHTDRSCYLQTAQTTVTVNGTGFGATQPYTAELDGEPLGSATTNDQGAMQAAIKPPAIDDGSDEQTYEVTVRADQDASARFTVTHFVAGFTPATGDPRTLRVRFFAYGFALGRAKPNVYLHYVTPGGKLVKTLRLGRGQGQCGSIEQTARKRLFPFERMRYGRWRLQFDTSKKYRAGVKGSPFLFYTVGVTVHRPR